MTEDPLDLETHRREPKMKRTARGGQGDALRFVSFKGGGFHGEMAAELCVADPAGEAIRLADPASSLETIHWGRNYIYAAEVRTADAGIEVVVKQFRNQGWRRMLDRRLRGSKAERSWRVAQELIRAGLATPRPLMWVESDAADGPSYFVAERLAGAVEVRQFFRRLNHEPGGEDFPAVQSAAFLAALGRLARRINDAGILYRDLSMGNVLAVADNGGGELELYLVDFNRARTGLRLGTYRRTRDICRLPVIESGHRASFLAGYWGEAPSRWEFRSWFHALSVRAYIFKHAVKKRLRGIRLHRKHAHGGSHHPHLPAAASGASARDKSVWDHLSDQPHQHASRLEKWAIRLADSPSHLRDLGIALSAAPEVARRYRELCAARYERPTPFSGIGLAVRPWPQAQDAQLRAIAELGVGPVMVRLHPWEAAHDGEERLAAALSAAGHEVSFAIPQNRDLVRDRARWRAAVTELAERFTPYGRHFQVGQAVNRSKWGVWTHQEYVDLYLEAAEILRRFQGVEVMGPAVIDFEFQSIMALINRRLPPLRFDIVSSLLYVDRRGAPENRQIGLDTADKVTLLRAIAEVGRCSSGRCWITEVNWPLWEGPHSPAGKTVSVGEEQQADYLVRYFLLALGTGLVERVFWWRLIARGYGLAAPSSDGSLRRRPSWFALRTLIERLDGTACHGPLTASDGARLYRFVRDDGAEIVVGWSVSGEVRATLPGPAVEVVSRDGSLLRPNPGPEVVLGPSPTYYHLERP
jgi:tRNA A-37 threonylcarbamoyl transferase component Bud32